MTTSTRIAIRLTPRASRDAVGARHEGVLDVRVTAPPVDGAANAALVRLLAKQLRVGRSAVRIVSGETARTKVVEVAGLAEREVWERLDVGA